MNATITTPRPVVGHYPTKGRSAGRRTVLIRPEAGRILSMNADLTITLEHEATGARFTVPRDIVTVD
jgi:hypothetical protein